MLPDSLIDLFDVAETEDFRRPGERSPALAALVHANIAQANLLRTTSAHFARRHDLNLVDFHVLLEAAHATDDQRTVTPGYISDHLALSASTLTSILERLVSRGLLTRDRDAADKRRVAVKYTRAAAELIMEFYRAIGQIYDSVFSDEAKLADALSCLGEFSSANRSLFESVRDRLI